VRDSAGREEQSNAGGRESDAGGPWVDGDEADEDIDNLNEMKLLQITKSSVAMVELIVENVRGKLPRIEPSQRIREWPHSTH